MRLKNLYNRYRKYFYFAIGILAVCFITFRAGMYVGAADQEAGSISDPLVTKSYLDSRLAQASGTMTKVTLQKGAVLNASEGAMMIVYSGNGTVSGSGNGLINVTTGELTVAGISLAKYNTYLFSDVATTVTASSTMTVFVTGTYSVGN